MHQASRSEAGPLRAARYWAASPVLRAAHAVLAGPCTTIDLFHPGFGLATLVALLLPLALTGVGVSVARRARPRPPSCLQPRGEGRKSTGRAPSS